MLIDGKTYKDNAGSYCTIGGATSVNENWVWSTSGNWYDRATGAHVSFTPTKGHFLMPAHSQFSIADHTPHIHKDWKLREGGIAVCGTCGHVANPSGSY